MQKSRKFFFKNSYLRSYIIYNLNSKLYFQIFSMILQAADMTRYFFCSPIILDCFSFIITAVYFTWQAQIASTTANFMNDVLKNDRWLPKILTTFVCDKCRSGNKWFLYAKLFGRNNPFAERTQLLLKITDIVH